MQVLLECPTDLQTDVHVFFEEAEGAAALGFRAIEGDIAVLEQPVWIVAVGWGDGDAEAGAGKGSVLAQLEGCEEGIQKSSREGRSPLGLGEADLDDGELVAAQARRRIGLAHAGDQTRRDLLEERVAGGVAEGVVDLLEAIEVDAEDRYHLAIAPGAGQGLLQAVPEEDPVGQAGQCVMVGKVLDLRFSPLALRGIANRDHMNAASLVRQVLGVDLHRETRSVAAEPNRLIGFAPVRDHVPHGRLPALRSQQVEHHVPVHVGEIDTEGLGEALVGIENLAALVDENALEGGIGKAAKSFFALPEPFLCRLRREVLVRKRADQAKGQQAEAGPGGGDRQQLGGMPGLAAMEAMAKGV